MTTILNPGRARSLWRNSRVLHVVSGNAWLTFDGKDMYLNNGEEILLQPGKSHAVLTALGNYPLVYEIR